MEGRSIALAVQKIAPAAESVPLAGVEHHEKVLENEEGRVGVYGWYVVVLLSVVNLFNYMDRMVLSVLAPAIKEELHLSDAQLGLLSGLAFSLFYAICGIPIARWADRGIRRNIVVVALGTWSIMTALSGAAQNFWHMFAARIGIGAGEAGCNPAAQSMMCDYIPLRSRPGVFALHQFGSYAGIMSGMMLAGLLGEVIGWRWTFVALGLPGIAVALVVRVTLREPRRGTFDVPRSPDERLDLAGTTKRLWYCNTYRLLILFAVLNGFVQSGLNQWWPSFYHRVNGLSLSEAGLSLGLAIGVGSALGSIVGGITANKAAQKSMELPLLLGAAATLLAAPAALCSLFTNSTVVSIALVSLTALLWSVSNGAVIATIQSVVTSQMRATASSIGVFATSVLGLGLGPTCIGLLSDVMASVVGREALRYALLAPVLLIPVMAIVLYAAAKVAPEDLKSVSSSIVAY